jgi:hypothetical protein
MLFWGIAVNAQPDIRLDLSTSRGIHRYYIDPPMLSTVKHLSAMRVRIEPAHLRS